MIGLFRRRRERITTEALAAAQSRVDARLARTYAEGLADGVLLALDHIENRPGVEGIPYHGPLPTELRAWIGDARRRAQAVRPQPLQPNRKQRRAAGRRKARA